MQKLSVLLKESERLRQAGSATRALQMLEAALELDTTSAWAWAHHGDILYEQLGRYDEAITSFCRAMDIEPAYAWALAHRGAAYERLNRFGEAEADLQSALRLKPAYTWALAMLARVYQMTARFEQAYEAVERVVERDHSLLPHWREERAMMRMLVRRHAEADEHFKIALAADPDDRFAHYNSVVNLAYWQGARAAAGSINRLRGRLNETIAKSSDSRAIDRSVYELGGLAALEGQYEHALTQLESAHEREAGLVLLSPAKKRARVDMAWNPLRQRARFIRLIENPS